MTTMRWWAVALVGGLTAAAPAPAQEPDFATFHTWTDVATIVEFSETFRYDGDYGLRGVISDDDWTLLYIRPSVRWKPKPWMTLHGGMALFYNFFPGDDLPELRPWVGLRLLGPRPGRWTISNTFRMEYRAFYLERTSDWEGNWRGRWQLQAVSPRFSIGSVREFYALGSVEPFFDVGSSVTGSFGDRFRFNLGLGRQVHKDLRVDLNYLFHTIRVPEAGGSMDVDDHVVRLRFFWTVGRSSSR